MPVTPFDRAADPAWWRRAVFYQVYVRSFADGNGDGVGDLLGLRQRLPYLRDLGVDALWITPFYPSPMVDHGYDVSDPRDVDPVFGDLAAFDALVADAHAMGLAVTIDLVPNHVSSQHAWFRAALAAPPGSRERARFHFRPGRGLEGELPPNNWVSVFGGPAWTRVPDGQWYLHVFTAEQPDLNWDDPEVAADLDTTMRFWLARGADGFRIDVAHGLAKPPGLPDMPDLDAAWRLGATGADGEPIVDRDPEDPRFDNDGVHALHRGLRRTLDDYPGAMAVGEIWVGDDERFARYVRPDELHLGFNFRLMDTEWDAAQTREGIERSIASLRSTGTPPCWVLSNHDRPRHRSRYGAGAIGLRRARAATLLLLALPGVAYLYNGEELGLPSVALPDAALQDPVWERTGHEERGRDAERVPLPWSGSAPPYGFSDSVDTWLPMPSDWAELTVEAESADRSSLLWLYREALAVRRRYPAAVTEVSWHDLGRDVVAFEHDGGLRCVVNMGADPVVLPAGEVVLASAPVTDGRLAGDSAVWVRRGSSPGTPSPRG